MKTFKAFSRWLLISCGPLKRKELIYYTLYQESHSHGVSEVISCRMCFWRFVIADVLIMKSLKNIERRYRMLI